MRKNVAIDRLRGFSVLVVICMHTLFFFPNVLPFLGRSLSNGYYGVTAFFCTSGFLITTNMLKRYDRAAGVDLYAFYVMRFGRIVPPLALLLLVLSWLSKTEVPYFGFTAPLSLKDSLWSAATLRYNVYYKHGGSQMLVWSVLSSLSIEEVFYLAYPLTAKLARRTSWLVGILVAIVVYAHWHRLGGGLPTIYDYFGCFDGIALGALSALAAKRFSGRLNRTAAWASIIAGTLLLGSTYATIEVNDHYELGLTLIALGAALTLFASQCVPFAGTRPSSYDPLAYLGKLSYEVYLFHMTIFALLSSVIIPRYPELVFAVAIFCAVALSDLIHRFYAEPLDRWLRTVLLSARLPRVAVPAAPMQQPSL